MTDYNAGNQPGGEGMISLLDQAGTMLENAAVIMGQYYKNLTDNGIPEVLAATMVTECHRRIILGVTGERK
jgi:hypothetical protein